MGRISFISLLLILFIVLLLILVLNRRVNKITGRRIAALLKACDKRYKNFIEKKINEHIIHHDNFDFDKDQIAHEAMELLKPQAETVISYINAAQGTEISVNYTDGTFPNVASLSEHLFLKKLKNRGKELKPDDEQRVFEAFTDSIKADISERIFKLKSETI